MWYAVKESYLEKAKVLRGRDIGAGGSLGLFWGGCVRITDGGWCYWGRSIP